MNMCSSLPAQIVNSITIQTFNKELDKHLASVHQMEFFHAQRICFYLVVAISVDYSCFLTFLHKFHDSLSILHGITFSSYQLRLEGRMGGEEPSILLSFCLYQVVIIVVVDSIK